MKPPKEPVSNVKDGRKTFTMPVITDCERREIPPDPPLQKGGTAAPSPFVKGDTGGFDDQGDKA